MTTIETHELDDVRGGFGALLGALIQNAAPIIQSVTGLVSAAKAGGGGPTVAGAQMASPAPAPADDGGGRRRVSVTVATGG